jgi:hypothetical protein
MKFYEYMTFLIIGTTTINLLWALYEQNWGAVGLSFTALFGWLNVAVYEKKDRDVRKYFSQQDF